ncbi:MAG TPA: PEGA domain-containing protein [Terriglobales bacterium]|jgi:PEGA domain|nr:PEGA domain-containing protein [Terriglobales bacterium]
MLRLLRSAAFVILGATALALYAADWQVGRIQSVRKDVASKTLYYVVNTPVTEDVTTYTVAVHVNDKLVTGFYEQDKVQDAPPSAWTETTPVWVRIEDKTMWLKGATSDEIKLTVSKSKPTAAMPPLTVEEIKILNRGARQMPEDTTIGFGAKEAAKEHEAVLPPPPPPPGGTINISTVPYLADVFVDGKDMGYSPAKVRLSPGKHSIRVSKNGYRPYVQDVQVALDSDQKLDIKLEKK